MAWIFLFTSGICEMTGVLMINKWHRDRNWQSLVYLITSFSASFILLSLAIQQLPMSTAYAVWTGIGSSGAALLGIIIYGESRNLLRILFISMILAATVGLKLIS